MKWLTKREQEIQAARWTAEATARFAEYEAEMAIEHLTNPLPEPDAMTLAYYAALNAAPAGVEVVAPGDFNGTQPRGGCYLNGRYIGRKVYAPYTELLGEAAQAA